MIPNVISLGESCDLSNEGLIDRIQNYWKSKVPNIPLNFKSL
jgi:hypothetical protein